MLVRLFGSSAVGGPVPETAVYMPVLKAYKFFGVFPTNVSDIALSYDSSDSLEEFTVELQVQWWDALDPTGATQLGSGS